MSRQEENGMPGRPRAGNSGPDTRRYPALSFSSRSIKGILTFSKTEGARTAAQAAMEQRLSTRKFLRLTSFRSSSSRSMCKAACPNFMRICP